MSEAQSGSSRLIIEMENSDVIEESPIHTELIIDQDRLTRKALRMSDVIVIVIKPPGVQLICRPDNKRTAILKGFATRRISGRLDCF